MSTGSHAVFVDRDGTLLKLVPYLHRVEEIEWIPGVPQAIRRLNDRKIPVLVVSNQAGVAHGHFSEDDVERVHDFMRASLAEQTGALIDAVYYCPYHPEGAVRLYRRDHPDRKPGTGMFERAIRKWSIDPTVSFAVGDRNNDLKPAKRLGMTTLLVETGYGRQERVETEADYVVEDFPAAVDRIIQDTL